jgi:hypothetical protein
VKASGPSPKVNWEIRASGHRLRSRTLFINLLNFLLAKNLKLPERARPTAGSVVSAFHSADPVQAQIKATVLPGRAYLFVLVKKVPPNGKLVRKVMPVPETDVTVIIVNRPDLFGFPPRGPKAPTTLGETRLAILIRDSCQLVTSLAELPIF